MAVKFPSPAVDGQVYPDVANGDTALENGRIYIYNGSKGIWELKPKDFTSSGALEVSNIPVMVHADNYEYDQGTVWYDSQYKPARGINPRIEETPFYWDGKYWAVASQKEFGEEIFVSDDDGKTWTPHSRITKKVNYSGVGNYTEYLMYFNNNDCSWTANDDVLMIKIQNSKESTSTTIYQSVYRLQKGSTTWEEVWRRNDNGVSYTKYTLSYAGGAFFMQAYSAFEFLRSTDNGTTWELLERKLTNPGATFYSNTYWNVVDLPDGRIATKMRVYTASSGASAAPNHLVVSDDLGETWTVLDEDMDATYPVPPGSSASPDWNKTHDTTLWMINDLLFSSIKVENVPSDDYLIEGRYGNFMLFYTEDVTSGVWHPVGGASYWRWDSGWWSPKQKRYYMRTYNNILMCATEQGLKNNEWTLLDEFGRPGPNTLKFRQYNQYDEINDRLVFINKLHTFDYYSFEDAPKGLGSDDLDNRLVTKRELKDYLKAPLLERSSTVDDPAMYKLSIPSLRRQSFGPNRANFYAQPQNNSHYYYVNSRVTNDQYPDIGQMGWVDYKNSSAIRVPNKGWGSNGFWAIHTRNLYNMLSLVHPNYFNTYDSSGNLKPIESKGFIYISDRGGPSTPSYDYDPIFDAIIPFTKYQVHYGTVWFDLNVTNVVYPRGSQGKYSSLSDFEGNNTYVTHVDGLFSQYTSKGTQKSTSSARHYPLNYKD
jgi:hypothetical protein